MASTDETGMGRPLRLAARSGEPHATHTANLRAGALGRIVRRSRSGHAHAVLRAMASKLGVARASVVPAYEHLLVEGYLESRHGSGTFIAGDLTGLAPRRRGIPRATMRPVPPSVQSFS